MTQGSEPPEGDSAASGDELRAAASGDELRVGPSTLVGGVGYHDLRDFSVGPLLVERLRAESWPDGVVVEDLSYDPVKVVHRLAGQDPPFRRLVVVSSVRRGRRAGTVTAYRWDRSLPNPAEIQDRVSEAVTGVIGLDNLLIVLRAFGEAPPEVYVVEIEPAVEAMGEALSPPVAEAAAEAARLARRLALHVGSEPAVPTSALGAGGTTNGHGAGPRVTPFDPLSLEAGTGDRRRGSDRAGRGDAPSTGGGS